MFPRLPLCVSQSPGPLLQGRRKDPVLEPAFPPLQLSLLCPAALGNTHRILAGDRQRTRALWVLQLPHRELAWVTDLTLTPESSPSTRQAVAAGEPCLLAEGGPRPERRWLSALLSARKRMDPRRAASLLQGGSQGSPMRCPGAGCLSLGLQMEGPLAHPETLEDTGTSEKSNR